MKTNIIKAKTIEIIIPNKAYLGKEICKIKLKIMKKRTLCQIKIKLMKDKDTKMTTTEIHSKI